MAITEGNDNLEPQASCMKCQGIMLLRDNLTMMKETYFVDGSVERLCGTPGV
jgi:hypothetical protein